jgi:hypothetical protein
LARANTAAFLDSQFGATKHHRLDDRGVAYFAETLAGLIDDCRRHGCAVVVCTFPRSFDNGQEPRLRRRLAQSALFFNPQLSVTGLIDAYERYNEAIRGVARERAVTLVDLDRAIPRGPGHFLDSIHLSPRGHGAVARAVAESLYRMSGLDGNRTGESPDDVVQ